MDSAAQNGFTEIASDVALRVLVRDVACAAFVYSGYVADKSRYYISSDCLVVDSPAGILYPSLPRCIHAYPSGDRPVKAPLVWRVHDEPEHMFSFAPIEFELEIPGYAEVASEEYLRLICVEADIAPRRHTIRQLTDADLPQFERIYAASGGGRFDRRLFANSIFVGCERDGELIGALGTHFLSDDPSLTMTGFFCVSPEHRGQGIAIDIVRGHNALLAPRFKTIVCDIVPTNEPALRVHYATGWKQTGAHFIGKLWKRKEAC